MTSSNTKFPRTGRSWESLRDELAGRRANAGDIPWDSPRNLKASYNAGEEVARIGWEAYSLFKGDNLIYGASLYPSLPELAEDVVEMGREMLAAPEGSGGTITTGGTESIVLAVRAALNAALARRSFEGKPRILMSTTTHAAFTKAADIMGLATDRVDVARYRADVDDIAKAVTPDTFMIVGSAFAYPFGHVDDIAGLSTLALEHGLWLHVDACVGGFILPFARDLGHDVPDFDFDVEGVRSMSADLHKYGYTPRGASLLLLRNAQDIEPQGFTFDAWQTGTFNTQTIVSSRPAGAVAGAWAVMNHLGHEGYRDLVRRTLEAKQSIIEALSGVDGIALCGEPEGTVIGYRGEDGIDMHAVREGLIARGWRMGVLVEPPGFQLLLNAFSGSIAETFAEELKQVIADVRAGKVAGGAGDMTYAV